MAEDDTPGYVLEFLQQVYPEVSSDIVAKDDRVTEEKCIRDATEIIRKFRARVEHVKRKQAERKKKGKPKQVKRREL